MRIVVMINYSIISCKKFKVAIYGHRVSNNSKTSNAFLAVTFNISKTSLIMIKLLETLA